MRRSVFLAVIFAAISSVCLAQEPATPKAAADQSVVKIGGPAASTPFTLTLQDMKDLPRKTLQVENPHTKKVEVYEGVPLAAVLKKAGVPVGDQLHGAALTMYVLVDATDNYRVVFSLAELDSGFEDSDILLADTMDGAPLKPGQGPFKIVAPHEKRPSRWVDMVTSITVNQAAN